MPEIAVKRDPEKWEDAKRDAVSRMGGKHSARAMQLASKIYKDRGGEYAGKKPSASNNSLRTWTKQDWKWSGGDKPGQGGSGVYLPSRAVSALKSTPQGRDKLDRAADVKRDATARGQQFSQHGLHVGKDRSKTAALSDIPHLARGVWENIKEHTIPAMQQEFQREDNSARFRQTNLFDPGVPFKERLALAKQLYDSHGGTHYKGPVGDRDLAVALRFGTMANRSRQPVAGEDPRDAAERRAESRMLFAVGERINAEDSHPRGPERYNRASDIFDHLNDMSLRANQRWARGAEGHDVTPTLYNAAAATARGQGPALSRADLMQVGARRADTAAPQHLSMLGDFRDAHQYDVDGRPVLIGRALPDVGNHFAPENATRPGAIAASNLTSLAHELGHATGTDAFRELYAHAKRTHKDSPWVAAAMIPEEVRAQMNAQDIMRDWSQRGVGGLPADLSTMPMESLKQHTAPLSTYIDAVIRGVAPHAMDFTRRLLRAAGAGSDET